MNDSRPKFLDLRVIRMPLPALVSILHRISGALMFLAIPLMLWMLQSSLSSIDTYTELAGALRHPLSKLVLVALLWALAQHFFGGIRFLAIDLGAGVDLRPARATSKWVLAASLALTAVLGALLW
jgi:succinate dehydrogenase / fumarate reductase cytochrome b subunit